MQSHVHGAGKWIRAVSFLILAALFSAPDTEAATIAVSNCNDTGPGSLRDAASVAASGDVLDLRGLSCNRIVLGSGRLELWHDDITLLGPGPGRLSIDGAYSYFPAIYHEGRGTIRIEGLTIENSRHEQGSHENGGCMRSLGSVQLVRSSVHHCLLRVRDDVYWTEVGRGGAVYAAGDLLVDRSSIHDAQLTTFGYGGAISAGGSITVLDSRIYNTSAYFGGAIGSFGPVTVRNSVISGNRARVGGAIYVEGAVLVENSTIAGNTASEPQHPARDDGLFVGGIYAQNGATLVNSTVSGNTAEHVSAMYLGGQEQAILNSTIAFNESSVSCQGAVRTFNELHVESTIIARNTCSGAPGVDIEINPGPVVGSHNLIETAIGALPDDTLRVDPRLAPLANNGGAMPTHLPTRSSPVVDQGNNILGLPYDQRGRPFRRERGASADIGAIEVRPRPK